jgi:hypothetical protein
MRAGRGRRELLRSRLCLPSGTRAFGREVSGLSLMGSVATEMGQRRAQMGSFASLHISNTANRACSRLALVSSTLERPRGHRFAHLSSPPCLSPILHPEDYANSINFVKCRDLVRFCDLSRTSPSEFTTQTLLTGFGLTCHARRVRAHRRVALASIGFVRITCPRSPPRHDQLTPSRVCVGRGWHRSRTT